MKRNVIGIVGWKNSGKTTLIEALLHECARRGLTVSTVKHAHHEFDVDAAGKDSHRHRVAGAQEVIVASRKRWAMMHELRGAEEPSLEQLLAHLGPCDLVLVEGFKDGSHEKIEIVRESRPEGLIADRHALVCAIATDNPALARGHHHLPLSDPAAILDFIVAKFDLKACIGSPRSVG